MSKSTSLSIVLAFALCPWASAQDVPSPATVGAPTPTTTPTPAPSPVEREGFVWGFSFGSGYSSHYRPAFAVHIGGMARPDLAVLLEAYGVATGGENDPTHAIFGVAAQYWPGQKRVWVKAGVGYGSLDDGTVDGESVARLGALGGVGFEIVRSRRFTVDAQLRGLATSGGGGATGSFNLGFNWY